MERCKLCGSTNILQHTHYINEEPHYDKIFDNLFVIQCKECLSSYVKNPPDLQKLSSYYKKNYHPANLSSKSKYNDRVVSAILLGQLFTEFNKKDLYIDLGPGRGLSFYAAKYLLDDPIISGVEHNKTTISLLKKEFKDIILKNSLSEIQKECAQKAKMIISMHCLEHFSINDLPVVLNEIYDSLDQNGVFVLAVPYCDLDRYNIIKHSPHLIFFAKEGLSQILSKTGFKIRLITRIYGENPASLNKIKKKDIDFLQSESDKKLFSAIHRGNWISNSQGYEIRCVCTK